MRRLFYTILLFMLGSCNSTVEFNSREELKDYILDQSHGITKSKEQQGLKIEVSVWPNRILFEEDHRKDSTLHFLVTIRGEQQFGVDVYAVSKFGDLFKLSSKQNTAQPLVANFQLLKPNLIQGLLAFNYTRKEDVALLIQGMGSKPISMNFLKNDINTVLD